MLKIGNMLYPNSCYNEVCYKGTTLYNTHPVGISLTIFTLNFVSSLSKYDSRVPKTTCKCINAIFKPLVNSA